MRRLLLWFLLVLLALPGLVSAQAQLINGSRVIAGWINHGLTTGTGTAYVLTLNPALPGYVDGACFLFRAHTANTGDATLNVNGKGAVPLRKWSGGAAVALVAGDISAQQDVEACYDATNGPRMQAFLWGTTGTGVTDGDKGDITVSSSGTVWTIDNTVVTYAKIQNVSATSRVLGRVSAGAGSIEELTVAQVKTLLGLTFGDLTGTATDAQIPDLNTLSTGLTPSRCVETDGTGKLGVAAAACGTTGSSTGISGASVNAPLYATGGTTATSTAPLTTGQVLMGSTGNPPVPTTLGTIQASQYGVVCNGTTDTTTMLQTVLNLRQAAPRTTTGFVISMPQGGQCRLTSTITIDSVNDLALMGNDVEFIWGGAAGVPMFVCRDCNLVRLENFRVRVSTSAPVSNVLQFENGASSSVTPTRNTVQFVTIECTNGGCVNGVVMAQGAGGDANDEFNFFSHMNVNNYTGSAFRIEHAQSKHNFLSHVGGSGNGIGQHFLRVDPRGSFVCEHCTGGGHLAADFHIVNATDFATIRDSNFEGSAALLDTGGPSTTPYPVNIENVRWDNTNLRANNRVIVYQYRGPLRLSGLFVEQGPTPKPTEIFINPLGAIGSFVAEGNAIATTLADPFTNIRPTSQSSNIRYDGSAWVALQDRTQAIPPAAQALSAGTVITADACGGAKLLTATGAATTNTTNTFDAPGGGNVGCRMDVCNTSAFALTLDANANFRTIDGNNVVLGAATASAVQCTSVTQTGTQWVQLTGVGTTGSSGFVDVAGTPTADQVALYVDANTIYGSSTLAMNVTDLDVSTATRTRPNKVGTTAPGSCTLGDTFVNSTTPASPTLSVCNNGNTFITVGTGGTLTDGDKTDITVSGSGTLWTIDPAAVTYAKIQNVSAASRLLGRGSAAGAGPLQELTLGTNLTLSGTVLNTTGEVPTTTTITTTAPLGGGGDLSINRTLTCSTCTTNAAALTANQLVLGAGGQATAAVGSLGTTTTVLHGNAAGAPTFGAVNLATDVSGDLLYANLTPATAASRLLGRGSAGGAGDWQEITLGTNLSLSGTTLNATGGSGTPGGTNGQVQYNNSTAFGGSNAFTMDGTQVLTTTRRVTALAASTTLTSAHGPVIRCTAPSADTILTLPTVTSTPSSHYELVKTDATAFACQFKAASGENLNNTLNGTASATTQNATVVVDVIDTAAWSAVSGKTSVNLGPTNPDVTGVLSAANLPLADSTQTTTGTDATRVVTPDGLAGSDFGKRYITMECVADATALTTGTGKCYFPLHPDFNGWNIVGSSAHVGAVVAATSGITVDIQRCGAVATGIRCSGTNVSVFSTPMTIDTNEDGTETGTAGTINSANQALATGQWLRVDVSGTFTAAQGLYVTMVLQKP